MPELPEVETIRRDLSKKILNKKIEEVLVLDKRTLKNFSIISQFKKELEGKEFKEIKRRGKLLIFEINSSFPSGEVVEGCVKKNNKFLLIHLKMTGQLIYELRSVSKESVDLVAGGHGELSPHYEGGVSQRGGVVLPNKHTRVVFEFTDNSKLYFNDMRLFGYLKIVSEKELKKVKEGFGVEPLLPEFSLAKILALIKGKKTNIKVFLLNQKNITGIGNIYADEICFVSGILPTRRVDTLAKKEIELIFKNIKKILKLAIEKRGTTFNNYRDSEGNKGNFFKYLKVYGRNGEKCKKCGGIIKKIKVAGRGTHYCEKCQK